MADCAFSYPMTAMLPALPHADATIWLADARRVDTAQFPRFESWLSATEAARYGRFRRPLRQRQFLLGRAMLRLAMGQMLGLPPAGITLEERPGQAPLLLAPPAGPYFSIAHSGSWIACAVSSEAALGLDIEVCDPHRDVLALALRAFGAAVSDELAAMPQSARTAVFYQRWSASEAAYKLGQDAGSSVTLAHPALSIVLCSATPLAQPPVLRVTTLASGDFL